MLDMYYLGRGIPILLHGRENQADFGFVFPGLWFDLREHRRAATGKLGIYPQFFRVGHHNNYVLPGI